MTSEHRTPHFRTIAACCCIPLCLCICQSPANAQTESDGVNEGNYNIKQSIEFGGRVTDIKGDPNSYDTFVNLHDGSRLLGFTTEMHSLNHDGAAFDNLYFSNFGYGGDPNDVSRLRLSKNRWYDFNLLFRRDQNFWDYSLLANPLNPTTPFANAAANFSPVVGFSPHSMDTIRHMGNYDLVLLPQSRLRFRLGYAHDTNEGPTLTTIHQGTEQLLFQNFRTTANTYHLGADFRASKKTNISYDQIWNYFRGDPTATDRNQLFSLSNGQPVDLGVSFNAPANQPCANTFSGPPAGAVNPACSAYLNFFRSQEVRTSSPTEQLSLQSNEIKNLDLSGRFSYTGGDANMFGYNQDWTGREARTNLRNDSLWGNAFGRRVIATADFGATLHLTDHLRFVDSFHFGNFHYPMALNSSDCSFFSPNLLASANVFTPLSTVPVNCAVPSDGTASTPTHSTSSGPDIAMALSSNFLKQDQQTNLAELEYQFSSKLGARVGFRYRHREIDDGTYSSVEEIFFPSNANRGDCTLVNGALPAGCTANGDGSFTFITPSPTFDTGQVLINEYAGAFGIWAQPLKDWRISFDTDLMSADNAFTRISPRQTQEYRVRTKYQAASWMSLEGSMRIWEGRDNISEVNNLQHDRSYGVSVLFQQGQKWALDISYDYDDVYSQILICYVSSTAPTGLAQCPGVTGLVQQLSTYTNTSNYGNVDLMWVPASRWTTHVGGNLTGTSGSAILLNPNAVPGPLNSKWLRPYGGVDYHLAKNWTAKAYWGYYGYHEDLTALAQDIFVPRNFHANMATLSVVYAF